MSQLVLPTGVNPVLVEFMETLGLKVGNNVTLDGLNKILQDNWFSKDAAFRFKITGDPPTDEQVDYLRSLGHVDAIHTPYLDQGWTEVLFLGAMIARVRDRLAFLCNEIRSGTAVRGPIFMLGSNRLLDPEKECENVLLTPAPNLPFKAGWSRPAATPVTEIDMMKFVVEQSDIPLDWKMTEWKIVYVPTPDVQIRGTDKIRPANTLDTVVEFFQRYRPDIGRTLVASNQPFVGYQETIVRRILPSAMSVVGIGPAANIKLPLKTFLDNIAKEIYERNLLSESVEA
jgi:hypothetical protein